MTKINCKVGELEDGIFWSAAEEFGELRGKTYNLGEMEAKQIVTMKDLSETARILLSAVAGALIQHLMDEGIPPKEIFSKGSFEVE